MASKKISTGVISRRYISAFIDLAEDGKLLGKIENDVCALSEMMNVSVDFVSFISNPLLSDNDKMSVIIDIAKKYRFNDLTLNFLSLLIRNKRLSMLPIFIKEFKREALDRKGEFVAGIKVANDISSAQVKEIEKIIGKAIGKKVIAKVETDKSILGGMVVTVGSVMIDDSIINKLDNLSRLMKNSNENIKEEVA